MAKVIKSKADEILLQEVSASDCRPCGNAAKDKEFRMSDYHYRVLVGTFRNYDDAFFLQLQLVDQGFAANISVGGKLYIVLVGDYEDMDEAAAKEAVFRRSGYNSMLIADSSNLE
jgi:cell division protein FtsN